MQCWILRFSNRKKILVEKVVEIRDKTYYGYIKFFYIKDKSSKGIQELCIIFSNML